MEINLANLIVPLMTVGLRVSGLMMFAPVFGSAALPIRIKAVLVIALTAVLYPALSTRLSAVTVAQWPLVVLHEFLIGMALGLAANLLFEAVQLAGQVMSIQMGFSLVSILDPQTQAESTVLALFQQTVAMLVFLAFNVHLALLRVVADSFEYLPVAGSPHQPGICRCDAAVGGGCVLAGRADCGAGGGGNPGRRRRNRVAGEGVAADAAHPAGTGHQEHAGRRGALGRHAVLARPITALLPRKLCSCRTTSAPREMTPDG